ncbi:DUF3189 family protein [Candidatus Formimonas warabiya]|uniref:DUF3189 family protein n=1 Tax=Formimonas warabiya TaxID=1761012 RepID=A0A3G1KNS0_FORW1|nr:DUF3189 family protein [Candidatus Formimonas warabiya]ATW24108.1 hypothetical protein DCMF_04325 [Candidatus Formimonas warabiya]
MKIIYCCYGGSHSSVTAAAIHLGMLPGTRRPTFQELLSVPFYEQQKAKDHGYFRFMGFDEYRNEVYIIGKHNLGPSFEKIIRQIGEAFHIDQQEIVLVDTMPYVNLAMMIGGFTSRRLGLERIGRPIVILGTQNAYFNLVSLVHRLKITVAGGRTTNGGTT